jgi:hypothetical protein
MSQGGNSLLVEIATRNRLQTGGKPISADGNPDYRFVLAKKDSEYRGD